MKQKNVLIIGSGGREHALAWALARSPQVAQVFVAPGNAGTDWPANPDPAGLQPCAASSNIPIAVDNFPALIDFATLNDIALTVVGPEVPLVLGIVDAFHKAGLPVFGPVQAAARLEGSKQFAKDFMAEAAIPTADYRIFTEYDNARDYVLANGDPFVVKASGLAAGKGVMVCDTPEETLAALQTIMVERAFGTAGDMVILEERLTGKEVSLLAFSDGKTVITMPPVRDHKRAYDNDQGSNTGGMGVFTHPPDLSAEDIEEIVRTVLRPAVDGMAALGTPYIGVLYAGMIDTPAGWRTLEFNCRFGDPETQVILPLLETDLLEILLACVEGRLSETAVRWKAGACASVVLASPGYPGDYPKGLPITGLESLSQQESVLAFHAGTARQDGEIVTAGGRVLGITALGDDLPNAVDNAYKALSAVHFEDMHYRRDIGRTGA
jgi:phosphoribosylamine--glycine ligase